MSRFDFRVWDEYGKRMVRVGFDTEGICIDGRNRPINGLAMQSTGLKGKNGVEIFEGDIIRISDAHNGSYWVGKIFSVYWKSSCWMIDDIHHLEDFKQYEIVGNIYENPELIKKGRT